MGDERGRFLTTEYTEAGESILKDTERSSVCSVWERSDLSVKFCGKNEVGGNKKRSRIRESADRD